MNNIQTLINLGAERLAEELMKLAEHSQTAADRIDYITSSRIENLDRFEVQLDELCNGAFYDWRSVDGYAYQLSQFISNPTLLTNSINFWYAKNTGVNIASGSGSQSEVAK